MALTAPGAERRPSRQAGPLIELRGVEKTFRTGRLAFPALRGIDLDVDEGDLVAIVGPSGSGKSTILNTSDGRPQGPPNGAGLRAREVARRAARFELISTPPRASPWSAAALRPQRHSSWSRVLRVIV